jgi:glycopeptide antibiotics resistance protein
MNQIKTFFNSTQLTFVLCGVYIMTLYWIIVLKFNINEYHASLDINRSVNWIPYREFVRYGKMDVYETLLNVLIFIPFGIYCEALFKKWSFELKIFIFFLLSFFFEASQYVMNLGSFDITDLINNTMGGILGMVILLLIEKNSVGEKKGRITFNIVAIIGTILLFSLILFLKINNIWIFRMQLLTR